MNRRDLLKAGVSILPVASRLSIGGAVAAGNLVPAAEAAQNPSPNTNLPWQRRIRRIGQLHMTEQHPPRDANPPAQRLPRRVDHHTMPDHLPAVMNVEAWADFWASVKADVV